ncbi:MAG: addiction module protein [Spirochaetia bacterium]|nr:addiction module protein [Spirochaetia bacterium]
MRDTIHLKNLSFSEKLLLAEELWDEISTNHSDSLELTENQKKELDLRLEAHQKNPEARQLWKERRKEFLGLQ